jgi:hypothetical protein
MPTSHPKARGRAKEPTLYDAVLDEFLAWFEENHDEWHRRMAKLHEDLARAHQKPDGRTHQGGISRR